MLRKARPGRPTRPRQRQAPDLVLSVPGVKYSNAFTGRNAATFTAATNAGLLFLVLDDFEERHTKGQTIDKIARDTSKVITNPEFLQKNIVGTGFGLLNRGPTEFAEYLKKDRAEYESRIKNLD